MVDQENASFSVKVREDRVAVLLMDVPGEPVNTLRASFAKDFDEVFLRLKLDSGVDAVVFGSAKPTGFIAGADISMIKDALEPGAAEALSESGQQALGRLAAFPKPIVAAIHGACLGGGLEVALACHGRVGSDDPKTKLGLPEVQLGVLPGAGGTQRLPRLIGVQKALDLLLTGRQLDSRKSLQAGLLDEVVPESILIEVAAARAKSLIEPKSETALERVRNFMDTEELTDRALSDNPLGRKVLFDQARKKLLKKSRGNYPAPERILEVVQTGLAEGFEAGLRAERDAFGELVRSKEAAQLINIFFATQSLKKDSGLKKGSAVSRAKVKTEPVTRLGVLGAGLMGAGIAFVSAYRNQAQVRLKDRDAEGVARGLRAVGKLVDGTVKRRRLSRFEGERLRTMITGTADYEGFASLDLVIEAVFEDVALKHRVLTEVEAVCSERTIFATNTSSIPVASIAKVSKRPENVIGLHYFSPVHKMPLLEVIVTDKTADWVVKTVVEFGKKQGKTVIVVNDGVGFYTTRILAPFMNEAAHLLSEGVAVDRIDRALVDFGFPIGPMKLTDEVGIDVGAKVGAIMQTEFGDRMRPPPGMALLAETDRMGRKNKRGIYLYDSQGKSTGEVDPTLYEDLGIEPHSDLPSAEIAERCTLAMVNEAVRCLSEGVLRQPRDGDIGAIFGLGFPPFRGGPFRYVDEVGADVVVRKLQRLRDLFGARFEPAPTLISMADKGERFYD